MHLQQPRKKMTR